MGNKELGSRYNDGKPRFTLALEAPNALEGLTRVLELGMKKYSRGNWRKGLKHTEIVDSMMRHLLKYLGGEDLDVESGQPHVDHVLCNALFLSEMVRTHPELDDREILSASQRGGNENETGNDKSDGDAFPGNLLR